MILTRRKLETILEFEKLKIHAELKGEIISRVYDLHTEINTLKECNRELNRKLNKFIEIASLQSKALNKLKTNKTGKFEEVIKNDRKTD